MFQKIIQGIKKYGIDYVLDRGIRVVLKLVTSHFKLKDVIIIESHNDFDCNGGAFYDYLIENNYNKRYRIVWLLKNKKPEKLPKNVYAYYIQKPSWSKNYYLCLARYLLSDCYITNKIRKDQISIYCTHGGCTFKNVKGNLVVPESVDYVLSPSETFDPFTCSNFSIPYPNTKMLHIGFPSDDKLFNTKENEFKKITEKEFKKYILWMPTFRKGGGIGRNDSEIELPMGVPLIENKNQLDWLNTLLSENNCLLVIKIHPMQDPETIKELHNKSNIIVLDGKSVKELNVDNYRLMASAHAFLSDYSSASYAYLQLNRPIGFVLSDMRYYKLGFSVDNIFDFMPGKWIYSIDDLVAFIKSVINDEDDYEKQRVELRDWIYEYADGNSCRRLAEFMNLANS